MPLAVASIQHTAVYKVTVSIYGIGLNDLRQDEEQMGKRMPGRERYLENKHGGQDGGQSRQQTKTATRSERLSG